MRAKAERLLELHEAHMDAISGGDQAFYDDGRHQELVDLAPEVNRALGIKLWHDAHEMLREALEIEDGGK
jgi:hypothetical protein